MGENVYASLAGTQEKPLTCDTWQTDSKLLGKTGRQNILQFFLANILFLC